MQARVQDEQRPASCNLTNTYDQRSVTPQHQVSRRQNVGFGFGSHFPWLCSPTSLQTLYELLPKCDMLLKIGESVDN